MSSRTTLFNEINSSSVMVEESVAGRTGRGRAMDDRICTVSGMSEDLLGDRVPERSALA